MTEETKPIDYHIYQEPRPKNYGLEITEKVVGFVIDHQDGLLKLLFVVLSYFACKTLIELVLCLLLMEFMFFFKAVLEKLNINVEVNNYGWGEDEAEDDSP